MNLNPGENSGLYAHMFSDLINRYDQPYWLWVRGSIMGDLDGDGKANQEVVIATIQKGDAKRPGAIEMALLLVCETGSDGQRQAVARTVLFDKNPIPDSPRPENDLASFEEVPLTRVRAQILPGEKTLKESVVVYFYGDTLPGTVWYAGYSLEGNRLEKFLETVMRQGTPGFLASNLDRRLETTPLGFQLVFGVEAVPREIVRRIDPNAKPPLWGHVYSRDHDGIYRQADERFGHHYREVENTWNQLYLNATLADFPPADLAWFEFHMALMNRYTGNEEMARRLMDKARKGAENPLLVEAIARHPDFTAETETKRP
jgi:hypothetical protein